MEPQPTGEQHQLLHALIGDWTFESKCKGPDGQEMPPSIGRAHGKAYGGLWVSVDMTSQDGEHSWVSQMNLGFDPTKQTFIGSFIASMMSHLWIYEGSYDPATRTISLDTQGPKFDGSPGLAPYRDHIRFIDDDTWQLRSEAPDDDGKWVQFMDAIYRRA